MLLKGLLRAPAPRSIISSAVFHLEGARLSIHRGPFPEPKRGGAKNFREELSSDPVLLLFHFITAGIAAVEFLGLFYFIWHYSYGSRCNIGIEMRDVQMI